MKKPSFEQRLAQSLQAQAAPQALKQRLAQIPEQFPQDSKTTAVSTLTWQIPAFAIAASILGFTLGFQGLLFPSAPEESQFMLAWLYGSLELGGLNL